MRKFTAEKFDKFLGQIFLGGFFLLSAFSVAGAETYYEKIIKHPEILRNQAFAISISSAGKNCPSVSHSFIRGVDKNGLVYITARCKGGADWLLMEGGGKKGRILSCALWKAISKTSCWTPFAIER